MKIRVVMQKFPFKFPKQSIQVIRETLNRRGYRDELPKVPAFLESAENSVSFYLISTDNTHNYSPAKVRRELKAVHTALMHVIIRLNGIGEKSHSAILFDAQCSGGFSKLKQRTEEMLIAVEQAALQAERMPNRLSLALSKDMLAYHVAKAMRRRLNIEPNGTKEGLFEQILAVVMEAATGRELSDLNRLACNGLAILHHRPGPSYHNRIIRITRNCPGENSGGKRG